MPKPQGFHLAMQTLIPTPSGCQGYKRLMEMLLRDHHLWSNPFILQVLIPTTHWEGKGLTRDPLARSCWPQDHQNRSPIFLTGDPPQSLGLAIKSVSPHLLQVSYPLAMGQHRKVPLNPGLSLAGFMCHMWLWGPWYVTGPNWDARKHDKVTLGLEYWACRWERKISHLWLYGVDRLKWYFG